MIGERIQYIRMEQGLTQLELAEKLNISKSSLSAYEQNTRLPNVETIIQLATLFDVSADYFLELTNKPNKLSTIQKREIYTIEIPDCVKKNNSALHDFEILKEFIIYKTNK